MILFGFAIVLPIAFLGLLLLVLGWRGRRLDEHPVCPGCRFDLDGIPEPEQCPECGRDLSQGMRLGNRKRRPVAIAMGVLFLLPLLGVITFVVASTELIRYQPLWMLRPAAKGDASVEAMEEIHRRYDDDLFSDRQLDVLADDAIEMLANDEWQVGWSSFIEKLQMDGHLDVEDEEEYYRLAFTPRLDVRARIRPGEPLPYQLTFLAPRLGPGSMVYLNTESVATFDGNASSNNVSGGGGSGVSANGSSSRSARIYPDEVFDPGTHTVRMDLTVDRMDSTRTNVVQTWTLPIETTFEVVENGEIETIDDPDLEAPLMEAISDVKVSARDKWANFEIRVDALPASLCGRIFLVTEDGAEFEFVDIRIQEGTMMTHHISHELESIPDRVRVIYRPDPELAWSHVFIERVWSREIDFGWMDVEMED